MLVRAYTYVRMLGAEGLRAVAENAVLNANYLQARLRDIYPVPHGDRTCMHEFVAQGKLAAAPGIRALDISKRLIDLGFHPPTNYFPLIVSEALMIEPTETESKETLDAFIEALVRIRARGGGEPGASPRCAPLAVDAQARRGEGRPGAAGHCGLTVPGAGPSASKSSRSDTPRRARQERRRFQGWAGLISSIIVRSRV